MPTRVTVNLRPRAAQALEDVVALTEESQTDVINRALVLYSRVVCLIQTDNVTVLLRAPGHKDEQLLLL